MASLVTQREKEKEKEKKKPASDSLLATARRSGLRRAIEFQRSGKRISRMGLFDSAIVHTQLWLHWAENVGF